MINATGGTASLEALASAGAENLAGKVLIDVSNALDPSQGMPPRVAVANDDSIGEQIQRAYPDTRVVKALNTVNMQVMVDPAGVPGDHVMFVAGNDDGREGCRSWSCWARFGWPAERIVDLGDITRRPGDGAVPRSLAAPARPARPRAVQHLAESGLTRAPPGKAVA